MNNNKSMVVYKEGFFTKIKRLFNKIFHTEKSEKNINEEAVNRINGQRQQINESFIEEIRIDDSKTVDAVKKKQFLDEINGNAEALNILSIDRLEKLEKYYDEIIRENAEKIKRLKESA